MRLIPSDPDIETIVSRIKSGDIDLQPDFQRGEVWPRSKKQRLIDSILRDWHVPPIHVIEDINSRKQEVLDGQQRLVAIRDFVDGDFPLDGKIDPIDLGIAELHGCKYHELPDVWRRRFNHFTIRLFRIVDFRPGEPGELFFRLNQPTSLTGAEQRNAFFGPVRAQMKGLVEQLEELGLGKEFFGFSNSRMAYDDVLSRTALYIERGSITTKISSSDLIELYRSETPISAATMNILSDAISLLANTQNHKSPSLKFNKATLASWLLVVARALMRDYFWVTPSTLAAFFSYFEEVSSGSMTDYRIDDRLPSYRLLSIYESRSSARVADVSSVILRDAIIWIFLYDFSSNFIQKNVDLDISQIWHALAEQSPSNIEDDNLARSLIEHGWGSLA
tara:strand:- start:1763 stop:2935 length:1173 start_codon:yes stop_codon:yes gene_type:complete